MHGLGNTRSLDAFKENLHAIISNARFRSKSTNAVHDRNKVSKECRLIVNHCTSITQNYGVHAECITCPMDTPHILFTCYHLILIMLRQINAIGPSPEWSARRCNHKCEPYTAKTPKVLPMMFHRI